MKEGELASEEVDEAAEAWQPLGESS